jgi:hypothetical protein
MMNELLTFLSSVAASATLSGLLLWLFKNWVSERLKNAIKYEYDQKLESYKTELQAKADWDLEEIRAELARARESDLERLRTELNRSSEDRARKLERLLRHYERQVEEFYGPLWNMVHQLYVCNHTKSQLVSGVRGEQISKVEEYYQNAYFGPLHNEIREIIKTKLYLVEGAEMPQSFYAYLKHALQERDQRTLAKDYRVDTSFLPGIEWPSQFHADIKQGFDSAMKNYEACLAGLKA